MAALKCAHAETGVDQGENMEYEYIQFQEDSKNLANLKERRDNILRLPVLKIGTQG